MPAEMLHEAGVTTSGTSPRAWDATMSADPVSSSDPKLLSGGWLRHWVGTAGEMSQPVLDHHYLVLHLGGPKRVRRSGGGACREVDVTSGQVTVVPRGSSFSWSTTGPIDFVHLYVDPKRYDRAVIEGFDRDPRSIELHDPIGLDAPLIERLILAMLEELGGEALPPKLYFEGLFDAVLLRLIRSATDACESASAARQAIAPYRLRRVQEYIAAHLAEDLDIQALADVAGLSRFHFSRAFQQTTGFSPYLFVTRARISHAKDALADPRRSVAAVALESGFNSPTQFGSTFKKLTGVSPREWRRRL